MREFSGMYKEKKTFTSSIVFTWYFAFAILLSCAKEKTMEEEENIVQTPVAGPIAAGCEGTEYDDWEKSPYVLPFPVGKSYEVNLSHCSGSYHGLGQPDQFAIDSAMTIGTKITASRAGKVMYVRESGEDGNHPNNLVIIGHGDDTYAQYMHLTQNGALVSVGDEVEQGDIIGLSGNTGLSGYPHLHFVVTKYSFRYPYESIPTTFKNTAANERSLKSYTTYEAFPYD